MTGIPDDVMTRPYSPLAYIRTDEELAAYVQEHVMTERERCKDIALSNAHADCEVAEQIAAMIEGRAIRKGEA